MSSFLELRQTRPDYGSQFEVLVAAILRICDRGLSKVDGGANAGLHSVQLAALARASGKRLYAFEPVPSTFRELLENTQRDFESVDAYCLALSDRIATTTFYFDTATPALSSLLPSAKPGENIKEIEVCTVPLDRVVREPVDAVKLDLEGADFIALRGAQKVIARAHPVIVFENGRGWDAKRLGYSEDEFFTFFERFDYRLFDLHGTELSRTTWSDKDVGFEFCAVGAAFEERILTLMKRFWGEIDNRQPISDWPECVRICRDPTAYLPGLLNI